MRENPRLIRMIDEQNTACPFPGSRKSAAWPERRGEEVNRKRVPCLMRSMGLEAISSRPRLSTAGKGHRVYPYLLRGVELEGRHGPPRLSMGNRVPSLIVIFARLTKPHDSMLLDGAGRTQDHRLAMSRALARSHPSPVH